jgi:hypothetical protein
MREWERQQTDRYKSERPKLSLVLTNKGVGSMNDLDCALRVALDFGSLQLHSRPITEIDRALGRGRSFAALREPF